MARRAVLAAAVALGWTGCGGEEAPPQGSEGLPLAPSSRELRITGLAVDRSEQATGLLSLRADDLVWRKRRYGAFSIAPLREVLLSDAQLRVSLPPPTPGPQAGEARASAMAESILDALSTVAVSGIITRVLAEPFAVRIEHGGGPVYDLDAARARVRWRREHVDLVDVRVLAPGGERLEAPRGRWLDRGERLAVAGGYVLTTAQGTQRGEQAVFLLGRSGRLAPGSPAGEQR